MSSRPQKRWCLNLKSEDVLSAVWTKVPTNKNHNRSLERFQISRPLQKSSLVVAAVCDRRGFPENHVSSALAERRYRGFAEVSYHVAQASVPASIGGVSPPCPQRHRDGALTRSRDGPRYIKTGNALAMSHCGFGVEMVECYYLILFDTFCADLIPRFENAKIRQKISWPTDGVLQVFVALRLS